MEKYSGLIALGILLVLLVVFIKYQANQEDVEEEEAPVIRQTTVETCTTPLDLNDEDAVIASLIASIELRNEIKKNVQVLSVRRVG